jgi:hypothetical protein
VSTRFVGLQQSLDAFFRGESAAVQHVSVVRSARRNFRRIHSVAEKRHLAGREALQHGIAHEAAGRQEAVDLLVAVEPSLCDRLGIQHQTVRHGSIGAAMDEDVAKIPLEAQRAEFSGTDHRMHRAYGLGIVKRKDHRDTAGFRDSYDRRGQLMIDVVAMQNVGSRLVYEPTHLSDGLAEFSSSHLP